MAVYIVQKEKTSIFYNHGEVYPAEPKFKLIQFIKGNIFCNFWYKFIKRQRWKFAVQTHIQMFSKCMTPTSFYLHFEVHVLHLFNVCTTFEVNLTTNEEAMASSEKLPQVPTLL